MKQQSHHAFGSKEHLEAFEKAVPFKVIPTNVPGAYVVEGNGEALDFATASTTDMLRRGLPFRRPGPDARAAVKETWQREFGPGAAGQKTIRPVLLPQMGHTHQLRAPIAGEETSFTGTQWAGGVVKGTWVSATGNWTVPTVTKPTEAAGTEGGWDSSSWVGMDGFSGAGYKGSTDVLQAGVQQKVDANNRASYIAWFEWFVPNGIQGAIGSISQGKVVLGETTPYSSALASLNGRLYLAWRGDGNDQMNVAVSNDNGRTFGGKMVTGDTSTNAPAICAHNGQLFLAWKGDGNDNLNVAQVSLNAAGAPTGLANKVILGDTSPFSPALASSNGALYLAWTGNGANQLNVSSSDDGRSFGNKIVSADTSSTGPSLAVNNGQVFIAWKGSGNDNLNVAVVDTDLSLGVATGISRKVILGDTSPRTPAIAGLNGYLFLSWKGDGNDQLNVMVSLDNGVTFGGKYISPETSPYGTALAPHNGKLMISWKGDSNDNIYVAPVTLAGFTEPAYRSQTNIANFPVNPGDTMTCAVSYVGSTAGVINFSNKTTGQQFTVTLAPPSGATFSGETVEWIMEAPSGGLPTSSLPSFTPVRFTSAFGCSAGQKVVANPKNGDTVAIKSSTKTLTSTSLGDDAVTISFTG